jgi:hypothetical protein
MRDNPLGTLVYEARTLSRGQLALRVVPVAAAAGYAVTLALAGDPGGGALASVLLAGGLAAALPRGLMPVVVVFYLVAGWVAAVDGGWTPLALPAALCLLALHTACALAAAVPASAALPHGYWRLHGGRVAVVAAATTAVWGLAWLASGVELPGGMAAALVALAALAAGYAGLYRALTRA